MTSIVYQGDCREVMATLDSASVDAVVCDPPYAEIDRPYGRLTEPDWHELMDNVIEQVRRVLKPCGSAVFILQPNSERVGRMRPWVFEFMAKWARQWNMVQDAWWWNHCTPPTIHCHRNRGLMRPSLKACVWLGESNCYRNQDAVLWTESMGNAAKRNGDRALRKMPSGMTMRDDRCCRVALDRGGVTPFNVLPMKGAGIEKGSHGAATPIALADWWTRYICVDGGTILDPFCGSGTMGVAATIQHKDFIGIDKESQYVDSARARIAAAVPKTERVT